MLSPIRHSHSASTVVRRMNSISCLRVGSRMQTESLWWSRTRRHLALGTSAWLTLIGEQCGLPTCPCAFTQHGVGKVWGRGACSFWFNGHHQQDSDRLTLMLQRRMQQRLPSTRRLVSRQEVSCGGQPQILLRLTSILSSLRLCVPTSAAEPHPSCVSLPCDGNTPGALRRFGRAAASDLAL